MHVFARADRIWLIACLSIVLLLSLLPLVPVVRSGAGLGTVINPVYLDDYNSPLIREVADGYPSIGNPWFFEHRNDLSPRHGLPYWISALPLVAGLSFAASAAVNFTVWSLVFFLLLYFVLKRSGLSLAWSAVGATYVYTQAYFVLMRPIAMQLAYPVLLAFVLSFMLWWERPADKYRGAMLAMAAALTFYTYVFLYQFSVVFLGLVFAHVLYMRDWVRVKHALQVGAWILLLSIPFMITALAQVEDPHYIEATIRAGLIFTHSPNVLGVQQGAAMVALVVCAYLMFRRILDSTGHVRDTRLINTFLLSGIAVVIVSLSGVVTGMDAETSYHMARFFNLWVIVSSVGIAYFLITAWSRIVRLPALKKIAIALTASIIIFINVQFPLRSVTLNFVVDDPASIKEEMTVLPALEWLNAQISEPRVVWVEPHNYRLTNNILLYTNHYVLTASNGALQLVSFEETQERYLVASAASEVSERSIAADIWFYGFGGHAVDMADTRNREVRQCRRLRLDLLGFACGQLTDTATLYAPLFASMYERYTKEIRPNIEDKLRKFHVTYVIKDTFVDIGFHPERLSFFKEVYSDGRFLIYQIN